MTVPDSKTCSRCGVEKPLSEYYFEKGRPRSRCKVCHRAALDARDPERIREIDARSHAKRRDKNRELARARAGKVNAQIRAKRAADPDKYRVPAKAWRDANLERARATQRASHARHKDETNAKIRADRKANPEKYRAYERTKKERHREAIRLRQRAYYEANTERFAMNRRKREARKAKVEFEPYTRTEIFERDAGRCRGCEKSLENKPGGFQIDHIVPISLGGPDIPANVQLMCPPCNRSKWANLEGQIHLPV